MIVVVFITVVTGALLLWALYTEQVPARTPPHARRWTGVPAPVDIRRRDFPLVVAGYDRAAVDAHLAALSLDFAALRATVARVEAEPSAPVEAEPLVTGPILPRGAAAEDSAWVPMPPPAPAAGDRPSLGSDRDV